jgi:hypothetical protein
MEEGRTTYNMEDNTGFTTQMITLDVVGIK